MKIKAHTKNVLTLGHWVRFYDTSFFYLLNGKLIVNLIIMINKIDFLLKISIGAVEELQSPIRTVS